MANKNRGVGRVPTGGRRQNTIQNQNQQEGDDLLVDVVERTSQAADFFERNRNLIVFTALGIAAVIVGLLVYNTFIKKPREATAMEQMQRAQVQFERDSFQLALTNPGQGYPGFLDVIDEYGGTPAGNLARYYAGVSYLNIGSYQAALDYLKQFKAKGDLLAIMKAGAIGDAHGELQEFGEAISSYERAVGQANDNALLGGYYLNKLGLLYRNQGQNDEALQAFRRLKEDFGQSPYAADADKYISLLSE
ncbi:MAG: tetratricopeptide repeat protein [Bacteroidota bacterium]